METFNMTRVNRVFHYWYPDDGEIEDDAERFESFGWTSAETVALKACERDFADRDGWERNDTPFTIAVKDDKGVITFWSGRHEPSVQHHVFPKDKTDP